MSNCWLKLSAFAMALILSALIFGCANTSTPVTPNPDLTPAYQDEGNHPAAEMEGSTLMGVYGFEFDEEAMVVQPVDLRSLDGHYNVTAFVYPPGCGGVGCLTYGITAWDPISRILDLNASIQNPTGLTAFDTRLIFRFFILRRLVNVDSYTPNYAPVGEINPFIAFSKADANRKFGPVPATVTEAVKIHWPMGAGGFMVNIVEACWPGHCREPYEINSIGTTGPIPPGGNTTVFCDVLDWQNDTSWVQVDTTPFTGGWTNLTLSSGNTWKATVSNTLGAAPGKYPCWIKAHSPDPNGVHQELFHKVVIVIPANKFAEIGTYLLPIGPCSIDIGVIGGGPGTANCSNILMSGITPGGPPICNAIDKYTPYYGALATYKSLINLDPANNTYQPYPLERIDATNDSAAGWNNYNSQLYVQPGYTPPNGIPNKYIYSNIDRNAVFNPMWPNDHRHFLQPFFDFNYFPIDVCDDFNRYQYALMIDYNNDARVMGFESAPAGNYLNNDIIYYTSLGAFIGPGAKQIEPGNDIGGIDAWQRTPTVSRIVILEHGSDWAVEAFDITNTAAGWGLDNVQWVFRSVFTDVKPIDIEILPPNAGFTPNPNRPTYCVLVDHTPSGGSGGDVWFYDMISNSYIGNLSSLGIGLSSPPVQGAPKFIDIDDGMFEIHVMQSTAAGPQVTVYNWI